MSPQLSAVIPIYNESALLRTATGDLIQKLRQRQRDFEIILAENGSTDDTLQQAETLCREFSNVRAFHVDVPNYGAALREGIRQARGDYVVCDEIDLGDIDFYDRAIAELDRGADMVIGSKRHPLSQDHRPWLRRQGTLVVNTLLRTTLGFRGTDTHGLKAFKKARLLPVIEQCVIGHNLFASELVIRASRAGLQIVEIPLKLQEIRPPTVGLLRRVPRVLADLGRLIYAIRIQKK